MARRSLVFALAATLLAAGASSAGAAQRLEPPDGQVISGVAPEWPASNVAAFAKLTGQPNVAVYHRFLGPLEPFADVLKELKSVDTAGMLTLRMMAGSSSSAGGNHQSIARGDVDGYFVAQAAAAAAYGRPLFLRPNWEMNGDWFMWSTYDRSGSQRAGNSPALYRQSWQRARIIFEGGSRATIDSRLAAVGLPGLTASASSVPSATNVAWVWSPTKGPVKQAGKPHTTLDYYPGDAYVDWVGVSLHQYGDTTLSHWTSTIDTKGDAVGRLDDFYNEFSVRRGKPMMLSEWAVAGAPLGNGDNPQYIRDVFAWVAARPKVKAQVYFNRQAGSIQHRLDSFAGSRTAFTEAVNRVHPIQNWRQISVGAPAPLPGAPVAPATAPAAPGPGGSAPGGAKPTPAASCSARALTGVMPAIRSRPGARAFRVGRTTLRLRATKRWVRGAVVARGGRVGRVTVAVRGKGTKAARTGSRRWVFGRALAKRHGAHDVVVVVRRRGAKPQRLRVRVATNRRVLKAATPRASCSASRLTGIMPAAGRASRSRGFRAGDAIVRLSATRRSVRGVVVARGDGGGPVGVKVGAKRAKVSRTGPRRWTFRRTLPLRKGRHDVVVVVRREGGANERLRIRVATTPQAVRAAAAVRRS